MHVCLDFTGDVELVAVEDDALQVGQQVALCDRVRTPGRMVVDCYRGNPRPSPVCNPPSQLVQLGAGLADLLGRVDDIVRGPDPPATLNFAYSSEDLSLYKP